MMQSPFLYTSAIQLVNTFAVSKMFFPLLFDCVPVPFSSEITNDIHFWNVDSPPNYSFVQTFDRLLPGAAKLMAKSANTEKDIERDIRNDPHSSLSDEARLKIGHQLEERLASAITVTSDSLKNCSAEFENLKAHWEETKKCESVQNEKSVEESTEISADQERFSPYFF